MDAKLTLKLDKDIIDKAKEFAHQKNTSLSRMVEIYFRSLNENNLQSKNTKLVNELSGIIKLDDTDKFKTDYTKHLMEKYK